MHNNRKTLLLTLGATFLLMAVLVAYFSRLMYTASHSYIDELGNDKASAITAELENYLENASSVLWVAADTVDHMVANGATTDEIIEYISRESANTADQFDESYTGIYGYINGSYVDGVGWVPPEDYDPTTRDWYKKSVAAAGQPIVVSPYIDAETGNMIISICKALTNTNDVLGMDLTLSGVQDTVEDIQINGCGYGFVLNYDGTVIAHHDISENGKNYSDNPERVDLFNNVMSTGKGNFDMVIDGRECTVFTSVVHDQWHLVIVVSNDDLFKDTSNILIVSILIGLVVFAFISAFYIISYMHERKVNKRMEAMKALEQQREYEAKILMLEKSAADSANKAKSDFLADMSHEIRTPINAVLGMNEMILRESKDEQILEYSSNIKSAGNTLLSLINNILDFSKIEDGKMSLIPVEFDTSSFINDLVNSISERARSKNLEFIVDIDDRVPSGLYGDDVRLSQVVMNLLTNAVKYTEKGKVTMRVRKCGTEGDNVKLRFEVADTGIGIKDEDLGKLFESFERIEEKRNRHIEGTGLGISIVVKLLAMMDSKLDVESKYGIGSTFGFDIMLRVVDPVPIGNYNERKKISSAADANAKHICAPGAKILVTDDNAMNIKVAVNFLKIFGITPVTCTSGKETIELMRKEKYDIVFLDHMMPEMDGIETLKALRDEDIIGETVVIALTANAVVGAEEQYLKAGFDGYLSKPIMVDDMEKTLKKYLPSSLIEVVEEEPAVTETLDSSLSVRKARFLGLNVDAGIGYACGEEDFYLELLSDYANACEEKCAELTSYFENNDLHNYEILVHSLKSSSKTIGADDVSEHAKALEFACKDGDGEFVKRYHEFFVEEYKSLAKKLLS